jgi:hypothetical protein
LLVLSHAVIHSKKKKIMAYRKQIFTVILEALILAANTAYGFHHIDLSSYIDIHLRG